MTERSTTGSARRLLSSLAGLVGLVVLVAVAGLALGTGRSSSSPSPEASAPPSVPAVGAVDPTASLVEPSPTVPPTPADTATPLPSATERRTEAPTPEPTRMPTPEPTPKPTPKPKPKPTPEPTHDPRPEGTPRVTKVSGSFGETLTVQGIKVRVQRTEPRVDALRCTTDDPERQGWTEQISYELRMTWPDAGDAVEPWVAVGKKPWNVLQFDGPSPFTSGADYIVTTCHRPGDTDQVLVEISPPGSPIVYLRWSFS